MEGRPWAEWGNSQKPVTQSQLAKVLARYEIGPKSFRFPDGRRLNGYERDQFTEAWDLYLTPNSSPTASTPDPERDTVTSRENTGQNDDFQPVTGDSRHASENGVSSSKDAGCHGVTGQERGGGEAIPAGEKVEAFEEGEF